MDGKKRFRPLGVTALAVSNILLGIWITTAQIQMLRSLPLLSIDFFDTDEIVINVNLVSGVSVACLGFIPLTLGIGLWQLLPWARIVSICLYSSIVVPSFAAAIHLIPDLSTTKQINLALGTVSVIALWILTSPKVVKAFSPRKQPKEQ